MVSMEKNVEEAVAGGTWVFLGSITASLAGFVFWVVITSLAGVESVGVASAIVSSSSIAVTVFSAGLGIAVMREVAARESSAFTASLVLAFLAGSAAAMLTVPLVHALGYGSLISITSLLALASTMSIALQSSLLGFERFRGYFLSVLAGSLAKMLVGIALALLGFRILAPLMGYISYPVVASVVALVLVASSASFRGSRLERAELRSLTVLSLSNYPFVLSNQLLAMLSVYVFAYLVREAVPTGILYMALMITLAIAAIPGSILSAVLPIATRRNTDPFAESFRVGLALATPVIVLVASAPTLVLKTINPGLAQGAGTLRVLLLSITPLTALTAIITKLNKEGETKKLVLIGATRLALLVALLPLLAKIMGVEGATIAFLIANVLLMPIVVKLEQQITRALLILWSIHAITVFFSSIAPINETNTALIALVASTVIMHTTNAYTLKELHDTLKIAINTILHKP